MIEPEKIQETKTRLYRKYEVSQMPLNDVYKMFGKIIDQDDQIGFRPINVCLWAKKKGFFTGSIATVKIKKK